jgi:hypothetical protein
MCIICHSDYIDFEIVTMRTRCKKGLIAYHKSNEIIAMKKHVEEDHFAFMKRLVEDFSYIAKAPIDQNASKKRAHVSPFEISRVFFISSKLKKDDPTHVGFLDDLMLLVVKRLLPMRIVKFV